MHARHPASEMLVPPISKNDSLKASASTAPPSDLVHPAITFQGHRFLRPNRDTGAYLAIDLIPSRLNDIHQHLWLAGLPHGARPLHRQKLLGRNILVTEDPNEHLVWFEEQIYIKPLPDCLLDYNYWKDKLCSDAELRKSACGLLLSYAWLVVHKSDLDIAKEHGLLSKDIEWVNWVAFLDDFLDNIDLQTLGDVNKRYRYGELRLSRLNAIYRLLPPSYSFHNVVRGYRSKSTWYKAFFERNFKWMLAVFAVLSVLLSALQVGLATTALQEYGPFQKAAYGFTIASMIAIVVIVVLVFIVWLALFCYHLLFTWQNDRAVNLRRRKDVSSP